MKRHRYGPSFLILFLSVAGLAPLSTHPLAAQSRTTSAVRGTVLRPDSTPVEGAIPPAVARTLYRSVVLLPPGRRDHEHPVHWAPFAFCGA